MKKTAFFTLIISFAVTLVFISCKKYFSCGHCNGTSDNKPPEALAGPDQTITLPTDSILLDGSNSNDPDGRINKWLWTKISGPASSNIVDATKETTMVKKLVAATYQFELKVTDDEGASSKDTVVITVDIVITTIHPPIANAGKDTMITLPDNSVTLDGTGSADPDNDIIGFEWTKFAGPSSFSFVTPNAARTQINYLVEGAYQFELKVTDAKGLSSRDTVQVVVKSEPNNSCNGGIRTACDGSSRQLFCAQLIQIGTLSQARNGIAVASVGNKILFAGASLSLSGSSTSGSSRVDIYDLSNNTWSTAQLSKWRSDMAAVTAGNKVFFAGGRLGDGAFDILFSTVDIYDASTNSWTVDSLSEPRAYIAAATIGDKVFFAGGEKDWSYRGSNRVDIYDLSSSRWSTATLSSQRKGMRAVTVNNKIYFAGGANQWQWYNDVSNQIDIYDNATNSWNTASLSEPKAFFPGIAVNNKIYWGGGYNGSTGWVASCKVEVNDVNAQSTSVSFLSKPFASWYAQNAVKKDNKIIFPFNGNTFDIYDVSTNAWTIGILPLSIEGAAIISVNNTIYIAGGLVNGVLTNQVWKLEF